MRITGDIANASPAPWRVEYVTRRNWAIVKAADDAVVAICHADNAEMMVSAVNQFYRAIAPRGKEPKAQRLESAPDSRAASGDTEPGE